MDEQRKGFLNWARAHKKELIFAGVGISALTAMIIGLRNREQLFEIWQNLKGQVRKMQMVPTKVVEEVSVAEHSTGLQEVALAIQVANHPKISCEPFDVSEHIRNLHEGWTASAEKLAEAKARGIPLLPEQTLVDSYIKGGAAA